MDKWNELRDMLIQGLVWAEAGDKNETERALKVTLEKMSELEIEKEIQWVGVKETKELNEYLQKMIQFMISSNTEAIIFFTDHNRDGYMLEAYDDFHWFELTNRKLILEDDCYCEF